MNVRRDLDRVIDDLLCDDPHRALMAYRRLSKDELPWLEQKAVLLARRHGWSWAKIGRALGRSRSNTRDRFVSLGPLLRSDPHAASNKRNADFVRLMRSQRFQDDPIAW